VQDSAAQKLFGLSEHIQTEELEVKQIDGLIAKVEERIQRLQSYSNFFVLLIFTIIYIAVLFLQRDVPASYKVEASVMDSIISKLPNTGRGGYFNSGTGAVGVLSSSDDFYSFMSTALIEPVFTSPVCGDGTCDAPLEYPGFGRFGCIPDCGRYTNVTSLTVSLLEFYKNTTATGG